MPSLFCLLEGLGVQDVGVFRTTLEAKDSPRDIEVRLWELVIASPVEGPRHEPAQLGINHCGLRQPDLQAEAGGRHIVHLRTDCLL